MVVRFLLRCLLKRSHARLYTPWAIIAVVPPVKGVSQITRSRSRETKKSKLTGRCLLASTTTTGARRTIWASRKEIFSTSSARRMPTGGSRSTRIAGTRGLSLVTILPNTSRWTPKSELNHGGSMVEQAHQSSSVYLLYAVTLG